MWRPLILYFPNISIPTEDSLDPNFIKWWNSLLDEKDRRDDGNFEIPQVSKIIFVFLNVAPKLVLIYDSRNDENTFWSRFHQVVCTLLDDHSIPYPSKNYCDFLRHFYKLRNKLNFETPEDVVKLISVIPQASDPAFMLWRFPERLDDPFLYFQTLLHMHNSHTSVWFSFLSKQGSIDQIFDRYLPLLAPACKFSVAATSSNIDLLITLLVDRFRLLANFLEVTDKFYSKLISLIQFSDLTIAITAFRAACFLFTFSRPKHTVEHHTNWLIELISSTDNVVELQYLAFHFTCQVKLTNFKYMNICKFIILRGISQPSDLIMLKRVLMMPQVDKPISALLYLINLSVNNKIWGKAASSILIEPLSRFSDQQSLISWMTTFVRKSFVFIGASKQLQKYSSKISLILNFYETISNAHVEWINKMAARFYSSLVNTRRLERKISTIEVEKITDFSFLNEIDLLLNKKIDLKQYFTFPDIEAEQIHVFPPVKVNARSTSAKVKPIVSARKIITKPGNCRRSIPIGGKSPRPKVTNVRPTATPKTITKSRSGGFPHKDRTIL
ncbi:hypothetical protein TRFO_23784 [Tritrichomonas foetus]|uniref:Uncharacterized protein n=1 Tax=Tritrichomonas foetus TaxID=1144522 RepID=A0A1J4KAA2_9EUKA|nr:hypothetical protein TRFO_23784 [Tritrichomonas foetus]|eukprot:OHT07840.1 hypothetical protein TRFO_23784 [Tritrichomonas foetus]